MFTTSHKGSDMKELTEGMALLFESALEPVIGTDGENIVLMNPAAVSAFGDHRGAEFSALLPEAVRALAPGQVAALYDAGGRVLAGGVVEEIR